MTATKVGLIGAGLMGERHARVLRSIPEVDLIGIADVDPARGRLVADRYRVGYFDSGEELVKQVEAVVVATPTPQHYDEARRALLTGRHVFVEKAITQFIEQGEDLDRLSKERGLLLQVGHIERYNPVYTELKKLVSNFKPVSLSFRRLSSFAASNLAVDVVLDLMIHDIDLALSLCPAPLVQIDATGAPVIGAVEEDIGNARLRFADGCVASITASRVSLKTERRMRIFARDRYLSADFQNRKLFVIRRTGEGATDFAMQEQAWEEHDSLAAEQAAFAASVLDGAPVAVDAAAGRRALDAALRIAASMAEVREDARKAGLI